MYMYVGQSNYTIVVTPRNTNLILIHFIFAKMERMNLTKQ